MFSKEEAKKIRQNFWITFGKRTALLPVDYGSKKKWILFKTGVKDLSFKFEAERKYARVCIDFEQQNMDKRIKFWEKFESIKTILNEAVEDELVWDELFSLENGKEISRIYCQLDGVSLYNEKKWPEIFDFFVVNMNAIENVFLDFKELIVDEN